MKKHVFQPFPAISSHFPAIFGEAGKKKSQVRGLGGRSTGPPVKDRPPPHLSVRSLSVRGSIRTCVHKFLPIQVHFFLFVCLFVCMFFFRSKSLTKNPPGEGGGRVTPPTPLAPPRGGRPW